MPQTLILTLLSMLLFSSAAFAVEAPASMATGRSSFLTQGLGATCHAFDLASDTLPCNPAFIAFNREARFKASLFFGNNVSYSKEASDLLNDRANQDTIQKLFSKQDRSEFQTYLEAGYWGQTWGVAVSPVRLNYFTSFRNPSLPEMTVFASQEESIRAQFGTYLGHDLFVGLQLRALHRKYVSKQFFLIDAFTEAGARMFEPEDQNVLFLEPGLVYAPENAPWNPQVYFTMMNFGLPDKRTPVFPARPEYHLGTSVHKELWAGTWGVALDLAWSKETEKLTEPLSVGSYYEFGILRLFAHFSEKSDGAGFQVASGALHLGLVSSSNVMEDGWNHEKRDRRLYLTLGAEL